MESGKIQAIRKPWELLLKTTFKKSQEGMAPWKKNIKELGCLKTV